MYIDALNSVNIMLQCDLSFNMWLLHQILHSKIYQLYFFKYIAQAKGRSKYCIRESSMND